MILKLLFFFLAAYFLFKLFYKPLKKDFTTRKQHSKNVPVLAVEALTICPVCSIYFQKKQGVSMGSNRFFCSQACANSYGEKL